MGGNDCTLAVLYRLVYGRARDRLGRFYCEQSPAEIRADPLAGLALNPEVMEEPESTACVTEAVEDTLAGRRPKW